MYCNKGKVNILSTIEKKEKVDDGYVHIYEYGKHLFHSMSERSCTLQETTIINMKDIMEIYNYDIKEIRSTNRDMKSYIDNCHKESERRASYPKHSTAHFENVANITIDSAILIP